MKSMLLLSLCLCTGPALGAETDTDAPEPLYRNGGYFGPESSDECPPHLPSAALKTATEAELQAKTRLTEAPKPTSP